MTAPSTCWQLIDDAARGDAAARQRFALDYLPAARAYLTARWRGTGLLQSVDDAVQEVFLDCFRQALQRFAPARANGFRTFFFGIARTTALHFETRRARARVRSDDAGAEPADDPVAREASASRLFDRAWAVARMRTAAQVLRDRARSAGAAAERRVELLRLRFEEGLPIRAIAARWQVDAAQLHHDFARARREFRAALTEVVQGDGDASPAAVEAEVRRLLEHLRSER
ncbi:MAG: sigma-70 family RNA polymerase sigma factor [Planctomycetes bacterium]|nr:sigma-70 family RNA polymerase sigma factor [Planctomycetota bacterium]